MSEEIALYKSELLNRANLEGDFEGIFPEESFFTQVTEMLNEAGIIDSPEYCSFRNSNLGLQIDGYVWNELERTMCALLVDFDGDDQSMPTITNAEINVLCKRSAKFFSKIQDDSFLKGLEATDPGRIAGEDILEKLSSIVKYRVILLTDKILSSRVKSLSMDAVNGVETTVEVWDLERVQALDSAGLESEPFKVDVNEFGCLDGILALPANIVDGEGTSTYLCMMPGSLLSDIYHKFGQKLLESNVRTFLDFRSSTNNGMRRTLLLEPYNFFAYNNGITVTTTGIECLDDDGVIRIKVLENMQIVNGGQTTSTIYFAPKDKGGIKTSSGDLLYRDIDLSKVMVQMKLSVISDESDADTIKSNIATYANSQNSIQASDLVSNHPFHINIEKRSRKQPMPAGETGLSTKWFYERVRGQYNTILRSKSTAQQKRWQAEFPKNQLFSKIDMAKYENTYRMRPFEVKGGAQKNLKLLGQKILKEYETDEDQFGAAFYKDLIAKVILFREADSAIAKSDWYKAERGFKAETVCYTLAFIRHLIMKNGADFNLDRIFQNQKLSKSLVCLVVDAGEFIRSKILDPEFREGVANPSEFSKKERAWDLIRELTFDLSGLDELDTIKGEALLDVKEERNETNKVSRVINVLEEIFTVTHFEWNEIADRNAKVFGEGHKNVGIPRACANFCQGGRQPTDKQMKLALQIRDKAYSDGFDFSV